MAVTNLSGQRFGRLSAIRATDKRSGTGVVWECLCDCGNTTLVSAQNLKSGNTRSCGCLRSEKLRRVDVIGYKFGRLTAIRATDKRSGTGVVWECLCDCGNTAFVSLQNLKNETIQSCGCLHKEIARATLEKNKEKRWVKK